MSTYRQMAYALQMHTKQDFDDSDMTIPLIVYWIKLVEVNLFVNRIKKQNHTADISNYLHEFSKVPLTKAENKGYILEIPDFISQLPDGKEIFKVMISHSRCEVPILVSRTTAGRISLLSIRKITSPSPTNPYFYYSIIDKKRVLRFYGLDCLEGVKVDFYARMATADTTEDIDSEIQLPADLHKVLYYEVYNLLKGGFIKPRDNRNDGVDASGDNQLNQLSVSNQTYPFPNEREDPEPQLY